MSIENFKEDDLEHYVPEMGCEIELLEIKPIPGITGYLASSL